MVRFGVSGNLTAFEAKTIGTKVLDRTAFEAVAAEAVEKHDSSGDRVPGQSVIKCPEAVPLVSSGVGRRTVDPEDYVLREYRGKVSSFLRRERSAEVEGCALVVYTKEAYLRDPDVLKPERTADREAVKNSDCTHVLVAVLAFAGPKAPLSPERLVHNLAGGNREAAKWTADEIRAKAAESEVYWNQWAVVAD